MESGKRGEWVWTRTVHTTFFLYRQTEIEENGKVSAIRTLVILIVEQWALGHLAQEFQENEFFFLVQFSLKEWKIVFKRLAVRWLGDYLLTIHGKQTA